MEIGASGETCWPFFVDLTVNTSYTSAMTEQEASRQSLSNEINGIASHLYTAYCDSVGGKAFNGDPLPDWATFSRDQSKQKQVKAWLAEHADAIEVFYLPSYSPELNPDEMANADIKQAVTKQAPARTKLQLVKAAAKHLRSVQRQPERIRKYFEHGPVRYAA